MKGVEYLLLDLGGVLYGVEYERTLRKLGLGKEELASLLQEPVLAAYERGEIDTEAFLRAWQARFPHLSEKALREAWNAMLLGPLPQAEKVLQALSVRYPIALLSNTNDLHLELVEPQIQPWKSYLVETFFSNRIGRRKPDPETYLDVLERLGWPPEKTLFVDDSAVNTAGAARAELKTYQLPANRPEELLQVLAVSFSSF
jgi:glucose-1-phosphatase